MVAAQAVVTLRGLMDASTGPRDERWHNRRDQTPMLVETAVSKLPEQSAEAPAPDQEVFSKEDSGAGPKTGTAAHTAPLDLFGDTALAGTPELTADMLPDVIAAFAKDEAERSGRGTRNGGASLPGRHGSGNPGPVEDTTKASGHLLEGECPFMGRDRRGQWQP